MLKVEFRAMGCQMAAFLDNEEKAAVKALQQVPGWFEEWEQALSRFRTDSELSRLNDLSGMETRVGTVLWEVARMAVDTASWTGGLVTPTVLDSLVRSGYDRSFDLLQSYSMLQSPVVQSTALQEAVDKTNDWKAILLNENRHSITLPAGVKLDLGGIAKGWAAQQSMLRLSNIGPALVDAGGDIAVSGPQADGAPWPVNVADPLLVQDNLDLLALESCGVATSGIDFRRWLKNGAWKHHIIDPRTGEPAETDLMSATIIAPDAMQAEAAAKAIMILGSQDGMHWLENYGQFCGLLALQDGRTLYSNGMAQYLWSSHVY